MEWQVRKARLTDANRIVELAGGYDNFLMPYVLSAFVVRNYINQFMVAETVAQVGIGVSPTSEVGGAIHYIDTSLVHGNNMTECDKVCSFLLHVKQVPEDIVDQFIITGGKVAFLGQIVCPGKGSFYAILEELKKQYDELWCWMSIVGPSYKSYERYGFKFLEERTFWNVYKCDYSTFTLGKWKKEEKGED